jgi:hypothetical protein
MAPQAACVHEGGGVERRAAHHERERQRRQREAAGGTTEPAAEEAMDVEAVSAADVLAGVEESGPNYALPTAREGQRERRERLRVDETAKQAGHTIVETGTHVEILGEQGLWWPATIAGREEDVDGRLVHEVEYDGYQGEQYWHMLDDEQWRRATAMPTPADGTNVAASTEGEESGGEESGGEESGGEEDAVAAGTRAGAHRRATAVQHSELADLLDGMDDERQEEAMRADDQPLLRPHGPSLSRQLVNVRRRLRDFLAQQAKKGKDVAMYRWEFLAPSRGGAPLLGETWSAD